MSKYPGDDDEWVENIDYKETRDYVEESDRRPARIPAPVSTEFLNLELESDAAIVGIDVGENFLDHRVDRARARRTALRAQSRWIKFAEQIASRRWPMSLPIEWPELRAGAVAIVDSPRCPIDTDCSQSHFAPRENPPARRAIDSGLRAMVNRLNENPARARKTQTVAVSDAADEIFHRMRTSSRMQVGILRSMGEQLFRPLESPAQIPARLTGGALFTRFMIVGFAVYQALATIGVDAYEGYSVPGLQNSG